MKSRLTTIYLSTGLLLSLTVFLTSYTRNVRYPGNHEGYEPVQPVAFSHRLHAGELGMACLHCHSAAEKSRTAGVPAASVCMNCHKMVASPFVNVKAEEELATKEKRKPQLILSPEIRKIYQAFGLDDSLKTDPVKSPRSIEWVKVHNLPDFVYFNHSAHVTAGVQCQTCHGEVQTMERVRQVSDLSMGWCVNCHRDANKNGVGGRAVKASLDCVACHM